MSYEHIDHFELHISDKFHDKLVKICCREEFSI